MGQVDNLVQQGGLPSKSYVLQSGVRLQLVYNESSISVKTFTMILLYREMKTIKIQYCTKDSVSLSLFTQVVILQTIYSRNQ